MDRDKLISSLFEKGKAYDIEEMEVYISKDSSVDFNIYEGELEKYIVAEEIGLSLRGIYNGKMGYSYTEKLAEENLDELIKNLIQYAENNHNETIEKISSQTLGVEEFIPRENLLNKYSEEDKINYLFDLEKRAYSVDTRVKTISQCSYGEKTESVYIRNTKGLELEDSHTIGTINLGAVTEEGRNMQTGYSHYLFNDLKEEYKEILIKDSVGDALMMLGAEPIESSNYEVILRNNVAADMFSSFLPIFFGSNVQKNLSLMKGKIGTEVAVDFFNIIEDPLMEDGKYYRTFDDEGTLTNKKYIIEKGVLKTFLYNNKIAEKENTSSTGNGFRDSHKSSIDIMSTNMCIEEGNKSLENMIKFMEKGIIIIDIDGLHAGINPTSGNFSLLSKGLLVEDGKVVRPLSQITMAGNLYEMLKNIKSIGNDTKFCHPSSNYFGSPSILVGKLTIAGK
ncbi:TldD/PmbA family protein [Tissierella sp. MB52-C2]|uniref:TldD/PmbA family protein n=1 Tax=Tissierella sp. MB52-C2 TaxID=3070999 RepID=UPI00280AA5F6|nr:TldD/PmbA family protein [Tissierella sp. MB52-C2]WMM24169.1 TldD/PmbA family protein [Tissierella sp. MB52-C2]